VGKLKYIKNWLHMLEFLQTGLEIEYRDCKGVKYNPSFGQNTQSQEKLDTTFKQNAL
jgi:hypothetical protein